MVLGELPVPGRPTYLDDSRARAYCACSRCGWALFGHFYSQLSFLSCFSLSLGDGPIYAEILSQRAVETNTTNQPTGGVMVLGKLPVPGRPTILMIVRQGSTALAVGAGGGCLDFLSSFSLSLGDGSI